VLRLGQPAKTRPTGRARCSLRWRDTAGDLRAAQNRCEIPVRSLSCSQGAFAYWLSPRRGTDRPSVTGAAPQPSPAGRWPPEALSLWNRGKQLASDLSDRRHGLPLALSQGAQYRRAGEGSPPRQSAIERPSYSTVPHQSASGGQRPAGPGCRGTMDRARGVVPARTWSSYRDGLLRIPPSGKQRDRSDEFLTPPV